VIAVASGKGGVGKSTVAANLAGACAKMGLKTGLMDADIYGPSAPRMFGLTDVPGLAQDRWRDRTAGGPWREAGLHGLLWSASAIRWSGARPWSPARSGNFSAR
jgi:Mrp family chromosome partitioning ATPase